MINNNKLPSPVSFCRMVGKAAIFPYFSNCMPHCKSIFSYSFLLLITVSLTGCITNKTLERAKEDRRNEKVTAINSQYVDTANLLIINFTAKFPGHKKGAYHISVPADSLI